MKTPDIKTLPFSLGQKSLARPDSPHYNGCLVFNAEGATIASIIGAPMHCTYEEWVVRASEHHMMRDALDHAQYIVHACNSYPKARDLLTDDLKRLSVMAQTLSKKPTKKQIESCVEWMEIMIKERANFLRVADERPTEG